MLRLQAHSYRVYPLVAVAMILSLLTSLASPPTAIQAAPLFPGRPAAGVQGVPLLDENFTYGDVGGNLTALSGGNWTAHSAAGTNPIQYTPSGLSLAGYASSGVGGAATFAANSGEDVNRTFAEQTSGTVYLAALVKIASATSGGDYFLHLKNATTGFAARVFARDVSGSLQFGVGTSSTPVWGATNFSYNTTYLVVAKHDMSNGNSDVYVLDTCISSEPAASLATATGTALTSIVAVAIRQGGASTTPAGTVDGIRVATNWADAATCSGATPTLTLSKTAPDRVNINRAFDYTLTLQNQLGFALNQVIITDSLPLSVTFQSASDGGVLLPGNVVSWTLPTLADGALVSRTITVTAPSVQATLVNADYQAWASNWLTPTHGVPVTTTVAPLDLVLTQSGSTYGVIGEQLVYHITLDNQGIVTATGLILTDTLPAGLTYVADDSIWPCPACTLGASGVITWQVGDLPPQVQQTLVLTVSITDSLPSGTVVVNQGQVSLGAAGDPPDNNLAQWTTTLYPLVSIHDVQYVADPASNDVSPYNTQYLWVEGVVTAEPGDLDVPSRAFVIEEAGGGPWSGIYVYRAAGYGSLVAPPGTVVRVLGRVKEYYGLTEMDLDTPTWAVEVLTTGGTPPAPAVIPTGDYDTAATAEQWESVLIEFRDAVVTNANPDAPSDYGEWAVDDGSGAARADDLGEQDGDLSYTRTLGDVFTFLRGIGYYSFSNYKIAPRSDDDLGLLLPYPLIEKSAPTLVSPGAVFTYTLTVRNPMGITLTNLLVSDTLPAGAAYLSGGTLNGNVVEWSIPALPDQSEVVLQFSVTAPMTDGVTLLNSQYAVVASEYPTPTFGAAVATAVGERLSIHHIQGAGHRSPFENRVVENVRGIVTLVWPAAEWPFSPGFFIQEPNPDGLEATSEGIFVYTGGAPTVSVGDLVSITATVSEYPRPGNDANLTLTQLKNPAITLLSVGNPLPPVTLLGFGGRLPPTEVIEDDISGTVGTNGLFDPANDGLDFYESLEGMLVQVQDPLAVGPTTRFGEIAVVSDSGLYATGLTPRSGIVLRDLAAYDDYNPERILVDDSYLPNNPTLTVGAHFSSDILGVVDYSFGNYKLINTQPLPAASGGVISETTFLTRTANQLTVATFNVENLDPNDPQARFDWLAHEIVVGLDAPDLIAVEEMQDNNGAIDNGVVDADLTFGKLIDAIVAAGGPLYEYRQINPVNDQDGGEPGGNIRVGFLFRTDRGLSFVDRPGGGATNPVAAVWGASGVELTFSPGRVEPTNPAWDASRKSLAGEFLFEGNKLFVIANHLKSKSGDTPLFGATQPPFLGSEAQRLAQVQSLSAFVQSILALDPQANIIVLGDMNDFQFSNPLLTLAGDDLHLLINTLPENERYTYVYDGNSQALDHILVSDALLPGATYDIVHMNAEFPADMRPTDHDPSLARLTLLPPSLQIAKSVTPNADVPLGGVVTYTITLSNHATAMAAGVWVTDVLPAEVTFGGWVTQNGATFDGETLTWQGVVPGGESLSWIFTATVGVSTDLYGRSVINSVEFSSTNDGAGLVQAAFTVGEPLLRISKSVELRHDPARPGEPLTYTIVIENAGAVAALDVHIEDALPESVIGEALNLTRTLQAGEVLTFTLQVTLSSEVAPGSVVLNTARYTCGNWSDEASVSFVVAATRKLYLPLIKR